MRTRSELLLRYLSLFSGVEAASLAWRPLGFEAVAFAEVDPFASAVLARRFPETPNLGDVCKIGEAELEKLGNIDVIIFGSPCQSFSVAGKREGMEDADGNRTSSGLFHEAIRIVRLASRINGCRWFIMENVPGMLSCGGGRDFAEILREISGCTFPVPSNGFRNSGVVKGVDGGWSAAWRTLDARFFGVPQRRRRVFIVGSLGHWTDPAKVLFVGQSMRRHPPQSKKTETNLARCVKSSSSGCYSSSDGQGTLIPDVAFTVKPQDRRTANGWNSNIVSQPVAFDCKAGGNTGFSIGETAGTLRGEGHGGGHAAIAYGISSDAVDRSGEGDGSAGERAGLGIIENASPALRARPNNAVAYGVTPINMRLTARGDKMTNNRQEGSSGGAPGTGIGEEGDPCPALGLSHVPAVAFAQNCRDELRLIGDDGNQVGALSAQPGMNQQSYILSTGVRRLLPVETERLQGFPDNHTDVPYRGKPATDGPRYKAIGNSFAVPVVRWLGERLQKAIETKP